MHPDGFIREGEEAHMDIVSGVRSTTWSRQSSTAGCTTRRGLGRAGRLDGAASGTVSPACAPPTPPGRPRVVKRL